MAPHADPQPPSPHTPGDEQTSPSLVLRAVNDLAFEPRPAPSLSDPHDVLVRVARTGICGSDVHYWRRGRIGKYELTGPMVLGNESSGTVAAVGPGAMSSK